MNTVQCIQCKGEFEVRPYRVGTAKFCSYACRGEWRAANWLGDKHPGWKGGDREKPCVQCGKPIAFDRPAVYGSRKFCSKACAKLGQKRYSGEGHPLYKADSRRRRRCGKHASWSRAVLGRDNATCQHCGARGVEMHAHHVKPYRDYPDLRWDVANGLTLCHACHWAVHTAVDANAVNSGNTLLARARGNPEPSSGRKPLEGLTTSGRAYRRYDGSCDWCGTFISKRWSDVVGKAALFCSRKCSAQYQSATRTGKSSMAVIATTSAAAERHEIV